MKKGYFFSVLLITIFLSSIQIGSAYEAGQPDSLGSRANQILSSPLTMPDAISMIAHLALGFPPGEDISLQAMVISIALVIFFIVIIHEALELLPFFGRGVKPWIASVILTLTISVAGGIHDSSRMLIDIFGFGFLGPAFSSLQSEIYLRIIIIVFALAIVAIPLTKLIRFIRNKEGLLDSETIGIRAGMAARRAEIERRIRREQ